MQLSTSEWKKDLYLSLCHWTLIINVTGLPLTLGFIGYEAPRLRRLPEKFSTEQVLSALQGSQAIMCPSLYFPDTDGRLGCMVQSYSQMDAEKELRAVLSSLSNMLVNSLFSGISDLREEERVPGA